MKVYPNLWILSLLSVTCAFTSCRMAHQHVDFTWFRDVCTKPQNDTVQVEAGSGLSPSSAPAPTARTNKSWAPWQQQQHTATTPPLMEGDTNQTRGTTPTSYTAQKGDTLLAIARKHKVSLSSLYTANSLDEVSSRRIKVGQVLRIPHTITTPFVSQGSSTSNYQPGTKALYTVCRGDTLSAIAARYHTSMIAIKKANNLTEKQANNIQVGQQLIIPQH